MRGAALLAMILLVGTVGLDLSTRRQQRNQREEARRNVAGTPIDVRVFATWSRELEPPRIDGKIVPDAIVVDEHFQWRSPLPGIGPAGLGMVRVDPDGRVGRLAVLDLASGTGDRERLERIAASAPAGTVLGLAGFGSLRLGPKTPPGARAAASRILALLGSRARPTEAMDASWGMITLRLQEGWHPLVEGWAQDRPVHLAFSIQPDLTLMRERGGELLRD